MASAETEIALLDAPITAARVFGRDEGPDEILAILEAKAKAFVPDITTRKGREEIKSVAHKFARSRTGLDDLGKEYTEDLKRQKDVVDAKRRRIRERLQELQDEVRKPLTDWENAEKDRVVGHNAAIEAMAALTDFSSPPSVGQVETQVERLAELNNRKWEEFEDQARDVYRQTMNRLEALADAAVKAEKDKADLDRLRAEDAERAAKQALEAAAAEEKAKAEKAAADLQAAKDQAVEDERKHAEQAKADLEAKAAKADQDRAAAVAQAAAAEADAEAKAVRAVEEDRRRALAAEAEEKRAAAAREADKQHRGAIHREILEALALIQPELSVEQMKAVVVAIASKKVPKVWIEY